MSQRQRMHLVDTVLPLLLRLRLRINLRLVFAPHLLADVRNPVALLLGAARAV